MFSMFRHLYFSPVPRNDQEARERHTENTNAVVPLVDSHKDVVAVGVGDLDLVHLRHLLGDLAHHVLGVDLLIGESLANRAGGRGHAWNPVFHSSTRPSFILVMSLMPKALSERTVKSSISLFLSKKSSEPSDNRVGIERTLAVDSDENGGVGLVVDEIVAAVDDVGHSA